ncbi:MAG: hypothetical protein KGO02_00735, partial [Alphaproteobacteria bacterium]|nr:hypothetical protein [Alphaproteobacteria bacterium]
MEREWLLCVLVIMLGGLALQLISWLPTPRAHRARGEAFERNAWLSLWWPIVPALLVAAWLAGWAATQLDPVRDRLGIWTLYVLWAPFAFIFARALARALWALLRPVPESGVSTIGLLHPRTLFSPFLARQLDNTAILAGCAVYHARPLPKAPNLASVPSLSVPVARLRVSWLKPQTFHPAMGLSETNVITLAVADNPALKAARLAAGVARAQLLVAGLLPDPQIGGGLSKSSLLTGYNVSVAEDIAALVTRGAAKRAAGDHLRQVHLNILWQEWQVA